MSLKAPWLYCAVVVLRKNRFPDIDIPLRIPPANHLRLRTSFGHIHCKCWSVRAPKFHAGDDGTNAPMATSLHQPPVVVVLRDDGQGSGTGSHCTLAEGVFTELTKPLTHTGACVVGVDLPGFGVSVGTALTHGTAIGTHTAAAVGAADERRGERGVDTYKVL